MEMEHALVSEVEQLAEEFADLPLAVVVRAVTSRVDDSRDADPHAVVRAARTDLIAYRK